MADRDLTGRLLAYVSLGPIFIIVGFVTLIVFKRELHTISFLGGLLLNEGVNWLIKNIVREPRPCAGLQDSKEACSVIAQIAPERKRIVFGLVGRGGHLPSGDRV
ncbi:UNVERIFIED_CONTAM: hypothetical protein K2H54_053854 [Gekko kuhli]